jgi:hypothetical protein
MFLQPQLLLMVVELNVRFIQLQLFLYVLQQQLPVENKASQVVDCVLPVIKHKFTVSEHLLLQ